MPAWRKDSPCRAHQRPTVPSVVARGQGVVGEVVEEFFGGEVDVVEGDDAGDRVAR